MNDNTEAKRLIAEYERLVIRVTRLFEEWNELDRRMIEIERVLPDDYPYPGDSGGDRSSP